MAKTILVIDDETEILEGMSRWLTEEGYAVVTAMNGSEAFEKLKEIRPSLIFLDIKMPGMGGFEVLQKLRGSPGTSSIPVIMLTATAETASILKAQNMRAVDYIVKPFLGDELIRLIRRYEPPF